MWIPINEEVICPDCDTPSDMDNLLGVCFSDDGKHVVPDVYDEYVGDCPVCRKLIYVDDVLCCGM